jgi:hypothetical protein
MLNDYLIEDKRDIDFALKKILEYLKKNRLLNYNNFKNNLLKKKINICVYRIHYTKWSDFGTAESFKL